MTFDPAALTADVLVTDEFGVTSSDSGGKRYGYLGSQQRSQEALGGTILMGKRVYDPETGRFLQTDPIVGGKRDRRCSTWSMEGTSWGDKKSYRCRTQYVYPDRHLGGWGYDVDIFTFVGTHFYFWGFRQPKNRYVKIFTGFEAECTHGKGTGFAPRCG